MRRARQQAVRLAGDDIDTLICERAGVLAHARRRAAQYRAQALAGHQSEAFAEALGRAVRQFADDIAVGFHSDDLPDEGARNRVLRQGIAARLTDLGDVSNEEEQG